MCCNRRQCIASALAISLRAKRRIDRARATSLLATMSSQLLDKCDLFEQIETMATWTPDFSRSDKPRYLAIADILAEDIGSGALSPGDRLPPQRRLAERLGVDFTTVARGYVEA